MKKILVELGGFKPSNIIGNNENFMLMARINSKPVFVANVTADLGVEWLDNNRQNANPATQVGHPLSQILSKEGRAFNFSWPVAALRKINTLVPGEKLWENCG